MTLKLIGYWFDPDLEKIYPHPKDLVDPQWHPEIRGKITEYLLHGEVFNSSWGHSYCRFEDVTNLIVIVKTLKLASQGFLIFDRTGVVICGRIAALWS